MLLFLLAAGLTLIFGMLGVINFAHGAIYMLGAYISYETGRRTGSFLMGVLAATLLTALVGAVVEKLTLCPLYERPPFLPVDPDFRADSGPERPGSLHLGARLPGSGDPTVVEWNGGHVGQHDPDVPAVRDRVRCAHFSGAVPGAGEEHLRHACTGREQRCGNGTHPGAAGGRDPYGGLRHRLRSVRARRCDCGALVSYRTGHGYQHHHRLLHRCDPRWPREHTGGYCRVDADRHGPRPWLCVPARLGGHHDFRAAHRHPPDTPAGLVLPDSEDCMKLSRFDIYFGILLAVAGILLPLLRPGEALIQLVTLAAIWAVFAVGFDFVFGSLGMVSFGHAHLPGGGWLCCGTGDPEIRAAIL